MKNLAKDMFEKNVPECIDFKQKVLRLGIYLFMGISIQNQ